MFRKLVITGAMVAAVVGGGLAPSANADGRDQPSDLIDIICKGPVIIGDKEDIKTDDISADGKGDDRVDPFHDEDRISIVQKCPDTNIENVANKTISVRGGRH